MLSKKLILICQSKCNFSQNMKILKKLLLSCKKRKSICNMNHLIVWIFYSKWKLDHNKSTKSLNFIFQIYVWLVFQWDSVRKEWNGEIYSVCCELERHTISYSLEDTLFHPIEVTTFSQYVFLLPPVNTATLHPYSEYCTTLNRKM